MKQRSLNELRQVKDAVYKHPYQEKKKTSKQVYEYENNRIKKYNERFEEILEELDAEDAVKDELLKLYKWNGHARAIKSKAYQEMKASKHE